MAREVALPVAAPLVEQEDEEGGRIIPASDSLLAAFASVLPFLEEAQLEAPPPTIRRKRYRLEAEVEEVEEERGREEEEVWGEGAELVAQLIRSLSFLALYGNVRSILQLVISSACAGTAMELPRHSCLLGEPSTTAAVRFQPWALGQLAVGCRAWQTRVAAHSQRILVDYHPGENLLSFNVLRQSIVV